MESIMDVHLEPAGVDRTLMTIEHRGRPGEAAPGHEAGWTSIAARLAATLG
jgi:hypothetical protein